MGTMYSTGNDLKLQVNDFSLCYDDAGKGELPLIFIHGFPFDKSSWTPQLNFLKSSKRVIAFDLRGYGKSSSGRKDISITQYADDLIQFMDVLEIDKAAFCGLSMGGYILLNAVNRYPERFEAIILSDTQCIADSPEGKEKRKKNIDLIQSGGLSEFTETFIKAVFCKTTLENNKELVERIRKIVLSTSPESITATLNALAQRDDTCNILSDISIPTLVVCGKEDIITPPAQSDFLQKNIPNAVSHIINDAGHLSNLEQPDAFNKILSDFLSGLSK